MALKKVYALVSLIIYLFSNNKKGKMQSYLIKTQLLQEISAENIVQSIIIIITLSRY